MEGGEKVKRIVTAWIEQVLEFPSEQEYLVYIRELERSGRKFKEVSNKQLGDGTVRIGIRKQYNNNTFPEDVKGGER